MVEITKRRKRRIAKHDERLRRKLLPRWTPLPEPESQYLDLAR